MGSSVEKMTYSFERNIFCENLDELSSLARQAAEVFEERIRQELDSFKSETIILFGAGSHGRYLAEALREYGLEIAGFCDNKPDLWGQKIDGLPVMSPEDLKKRPEVSLYYALYNRLQIAGIAEQLEKMGLASEGTERFRKMLSFMELRLALDRLSYFQSRLSEVALIYDGLADEKSRFVYLNILKTWMIFAGSRHIWSMLGEGAQYWALPEFRRLPGGVFADVGAYVGDTVEAFVINNLNSGFKKIYAFEPVAETFAILTRNVERLMADYELPAGSIECLKLNLGLRPDSPGVETDIVSARHPVIFDGLVRVWPTGESRLLLDDRLFDSGVLPMAPSADQTKMYELDEFFQNRELDLIKMDTEGCEMNILRSGAGIISARKLKLAISIYHRFEDLFNIPLYLKQLVPDYKIAVRHHNPVTSEETILYCWRP